MARLSLRLEKPFDVQGHRGARGLWPENTLTGFAHALALGVSTLELDCAVTSDGVVVVSHDPQPNPDHTRDAQGRFLARPGLPICAMSYAELEQYDVGRLRPGSAYAARFPEQQAVDGERIPRLADVLAMVAERADQGARCNVEAKLFPLQPELTLAPAPFMRALLAAVRETGMESRTTIQSFDWRALKIVHAKAPQMATSALTDQQGDDDTVYLGRTEPSPWLGGLDVRDFEGSIPQLARASGAAVWSPNHLDLTATHVVEAHELGLTVIPWTVNEFADMHRMVRLGVDGLISDRPDRLRVVLQGHGIAVPAPRPVAF
jgi:glycerophosphoryl diester phosphodiesterase